MGTMGENASTLPCGGGLQAGVRWRGTHHKPFIHSPFKPQHHAGSQCHPSALHTRHAS